MGRPRKNPEEGAFQLGITPRPEEEVQHQPVAVGLSEIGRVVMAQKERGFISVDDLDEADDDPYMVKTLPKVVDGKPVKYTLIARDQFTTHPHAKYVMPVTKDLTEKPEFAHLSPLYFDVEGIFRVGSRIMCYWPQELHDRVLQLERERSTSYMAIKAMNDRAEGRGHVVTRETLNGDRPDVKGEFSSELDIAPTDELKAAMSQFAGRPA